MMGDAPDTLVLPERLASHIPVCTRPDGSGELPGWSWTGATTYAEYARVTPSVRLARWEDGHPERFTSTTKLATAWRSYAQDERGRHWARTGRTRDRARAALWAALDQAEGVSDADS